MVPVRLPSGREILLLSVPADTLMTAQSTDEPVYKDVSFHIEFQDLVDVAAEIGALLRQGIEKILPSKASVELNIGVDAKTGKITAFFVEGGANGSIKIALEWDRERPAPT
ncbi:hypothetical protein B0I32_115312 [Nonomuraea fuscirosea]|uniref:Trypsin-co-occurring domain-containing protein n=1 Tax=Nonomuraea fuscirosea TaxID=1291556 RepID=A0A2T0MSJ8_9ACTN|nr:CU044_2847 family protein [Nonomuraea fuscirosea]PRX61455.1 hypothetical protein B0I32_115312 [Nonomuraea fuscirosea]